MKTMTVLILLLLTAPAYADFVLYDSDEAGWLAAAQATGGTIVEGLIPAGSYRHFEPWGGHQLDTNGYYDCQGIYASLCDSTERGYLSDIEAVYDSFFITFDESLLGMWWRTGMPLLGVPLHFEFMDGHDYCQPRTRAGLSCNITSVGFINDNGAFTGQFQVWGTDPGYGIIAGYPDRVLLAPIATPEPATWLLVLSGLGLMWWRKGAHGR